MAQFRRTMLKAGMALPLAAPAAAAVAGRDIELIRLCAEFDVLERRTQVLPGNQPSGSREEAERAALYEALTDQQGELLDRICGLPCTTAAGVQALAATAALHLGEDEMQDDPDGDMIERLTAALLRGIVRGQA